MSSSFASSKPLVIPTSIEVKLSERELSIQGPLGVLYQYIDENNAKVVIVANQLTVHALNASKYAKSLVGTLSALISNMIKGVTLGFEKKLLIIGVGYKAQATGNILNLNLGFSHPVVFSVPEGIKIETPSATEISIKGIDKQKVGQIAAEVRSYRRPEPYKGKGIRYSDEKVVIKETKKK